MLTVATGCDNVAWGGAAVELRTPAPPEGDTAEALDPGADSPEGAGAPAPARPSGPVLLAGTRDGARGTFVVVGEVDGDALRAPDAPPEAAERVRRLTDVGSRWTLFAEGVRVGTFVVEAASQASEYCPVRPALSGTVELVPTAGEAERFLALPESVGTSRVYDAFSALDDVYDQRVATLTWAGEAIPRFGGSWPPEGLVAAREDIRAFQPSTGTGPLVAATFVHRDELGVGPARAGAYALFLLGGRTGGEYREHFAWYRAADAEGKGAPRYFDHLDWDADGDAELLLDVFGASRRWFAALAQRGGAWTRTYQDACGAATSAGG